MMYTEWAEHNNRATIKKRSLSGETGQRRLSIVDAIDDGPDRVEVTGRWTTRL
jgi:hypothetical protein